MFKIKIKFVPANSSDDFERATKEYRNIWEEDGGKIVKKFEELSGLDFIEKEITAVVFEGISNSGKVYFSPMKLRASNPLEQKKATLIHELGHRLLFQYGIKGNEKLGIHQILYLILYDIWADLYGKDFADQQVEIESNRKNPRAPYRECWQWALRKNKKERKSLFLKIVQEYEEKDTLKAIKCYESEKRAGKLKMAKKASEFL